MALEQDVALLSRVPPFQRLNKDALRLLAFSAEPQDLQTGDIVFRAGDVSDGGFVVVKGGIALINGKGKAVGAAIGPERLIGELALITETFRPVTAVAEMPSMVLHITRASFRRTLQEYPDAAQALVRDMKDRIAALSHELATAKSSFGVSD